MSVDEMIKILQGHAGIQSSQSRKQSALIADKLRSTEARLRAADDLYEVVDSWNEPFFKAWLDAYRNAGKGDV